MSTKLRTRMQGTGGETNEMRKIPPQASGRVLDCPVPIPIPIPTLTFLIFPVWSVSLASHLSSPCHISCLSSPLPPLPPISLTSHLPCLLSLLCLISLASHLPCASSPLHLVPFVSHLISPCLSSLASHLPCLTSPCLTSPHPTSPLPHISSLSCLVSLMPHPSCALSLFPSPPFCVSSRLDPYSPCKQLLTAVVGEIWSASALAIIICTMHPHSTS